jgi:hypothetical protein
MKIEKPVAIVLNKSVPDDLIGSLLVAEKPGSAIGFGDEEKVRRMQSVRRR